MTEKLQTIALPTAIEINLKHHDDEDETIFDLTRIAESKRRDALVGMIKFAISQAAGDADASLKDSSEDEKKAAVYAKFLRICSGELILQSGIRGKRVKSVEEFAEREWLLINKPDSMKSSKGKQINISAVLFGVFQSEIYNRFPDDKAAREAALAKAKDKFPAWREKFRARPEVAELIEAERRSRMTKEAAKHIDNSQVEADLDELFAD